MVDTFYYIDANGNSTPFNESTTEFNITWGPARPSVLAFFGTWDDNQHISTICARAVDISGYFHWDNEMYVSSQHTDNGSSTYIVTSSDIYYILNAYNNANSLEYNAFILKYKATLQFEVDNFPSILPGEITWTPDSQQAYPERQTIKYEYAPFSISEGITIGEVSISYNSFYVEVIDQNQGPSISIYDSTDGQTKTLLGHYTNCNSVSDEIGTAEPGKFKIITFEGYGLISRTHTLTLNLGVQVDVLNGYTNSPIISGTSLSVGTRIIIDTHNVTGVYSIYITANRLDITEECIILYENINDVLVNVLYMPDADITLNVGYTLNIQCNPTNGGAFSLIVRDIPTIYSDNLIVKAEDSVQITPKAYNGFSYDNMVIYVGGSSFGQTISNQSFTMPHNNVSIVVKFDQIISPSYQISTNVNGQGSISTEPSGYSIEGETVIVTVSPAQNFALYSLTYTYSNNSPITIELDEDDHYSFTMPAADVTVNASFIQEYQLTVVCVEHCAVTCRTVNNETINGTNNVFTIGAGTTVILTATSTDGYVFDGWYANYDQNDGYSGLECSGLEYNLQINSNKTLYTKVKEPVQSYPLTLHNVHFGDNNETVCSLKANGVSISTQQIPENTDVALTYNIENDAFSFKEFKVYQDEELIALNNNHFTMPDKAITVRASVYKKLINVDPTNINAQVTFTFKGKSITLDCPYSIYGRHLDIENPISS